MSVEKEPDKLRADIAACLAQLEDLESPPAEPLPLLNKLKIYSRSRDAILAGELHSADSLAILFEYAIPSRAGDDCAREVLAIMANSGVLVVHSRETMVRLGFAPALAHFFSEAEDVRDHFLLGRLLLLCTDQTSLNYNHLLENQALAESVVKWIGKHAAGDYAGLPTTTIPNANMALAELLKLLYALLSHHSLLGYGHDFAGAIPSLLKLLDETDIDPKKPDEPPVNHIIHALFKFEISLFEKDDLFPEEEPSKFSSKLVQILTDAVDAYTEQALDLAVAPVLGLLGEMYKKAPEDVRDSIKTSLLPSADERTKPLGQSGTLAAKLLRLSTSGYTPELRKVIPVVLFTLSDDDADKLVRNVGYGYAAGFLKAHRIPFTPEQAAALGEDSDDEGPDPNPVNPITGQYLAYEQIPRPQEPPMTDEEKEREAERLFVLFERLKATGIMDVVNPVEQAVRSGRFEELE